ncbi:MAG: dihydroneopterin aldolase [Pseudomonadota bacterium]
MDIIFLNGLKAETTIGVFDWERQIRQSVIIDLELGTDIAQAARTDSIENTLSYKDVAKRVVQFVESSEFQLVETLAERIAALILDEFDVPWMRLRLNKHGAVRGALDVGVLIERSR